MTPKTPASFLTAMGDVYPVPSSPTPNAVPPKMPFPVQACGAKDPWDRELSRDITRAVQP